MIGSPTTDDVSDDRLDIHINEAYRDIATKFPHHKARKLCSFPTVAGTSDYGLPAEAEAVLRVWDETNGKWLKKVGDTFLVQWDTLNEPDAQPENYIRLREFIRLYPTPDGIYTIWIFHREEIADLAADGDEPVINLSWHPAIPRLARYKYYDEQGDIPKAQYAFTAYQAWLSDKPTEFEEESRDIDSGVTIPTLQRRKTSQLDFERSA